MSVCENMHFSINSFRTRFALTASIVLWKVRNFTLKFPKLAHSLVRALLFQYREQT